MTIPRTQKQEDKTYVAQTQARKWDQKHWLIVIALVCVVFWLSSNRIREANWLPEVNKWLPVASGLFFVGEKLFKLAQ